MLKVTAVLPLDYPKPHMSKSRFAKRFCVTLYTLEQGCSIHQSLEGFASTSAGGSKLNAVLSFIGALI